ncbi:hypothetical protein HDU96_008415 [Phlyctochytrium bullatum]|nr:hypothetical protein HDU96_008415 [Phlyctochytrium bullatum]
MARGSRRRRTHIANTTMPRRGLEWITLGFDGATRPNPGGRGGWGAVCYGLVDSHVFRTPLVWSGTVGTSLTRSDVAEYMGLISGLRNLLQALQTASIHPKTVSLIVTGDCEMVIHQMRGTTPPTTNATHEILHLIASELTRRFGSIQFTQIPRKLNRSADALAGEAAGRPTLMHQRTFFCPDPGKTLMSEIDGYRFAASVDLLDGKGHGWPCRSLIDAQFLLTHLRGPQGGAKAFRNLRDPSPIVSVEVIGPGFGRNGQMGVLGILRKLFVVVEHADRNGLMQRFSLTLVNVLVVHELPVPMHIVLQGSEPVWVMHLGCFVGKEPARAMPFNPRAFPREFRGRPFWRGFLMDRRSGVTHWCERRRQSQNEDGVDR